MIWRPFLLVTLCLSVSGLLIAQIPPPFSCAASVEEVPFVRGDAVTERVADIILDCTGGTPTLPGQQIPTVDLRVYFNRPVTGRLLNGVRSEALVFLDDPSPEQQYACVPASGEDSCYNYAGQPLGSGEPGTSTTPGANKNVFQLHMGSETNVIEVLDVPIDPPGELTSRRIRFTNLRVHSYMPVVNTWVVAYVSASGTSYMPPINNPQMIVGDTAEGGRALIKAAETDGYSFEIEVREGFADSFKRRNVATSATTPPTVDHLDDQDTPGAAPGTETGFYNSDFPSDMGLDHAGLADFGTRIRIGFPYYAPYADSIAASITEIGGSDSIHARMVHSGTDGDGLYNPSPSTNPTPLPGTSPPQQPGFYSFFDYEILGNDPSSVETLRFGFVVDGAVVDFRDVEVTVSFAPDLGVDSDSASETYAIPRFNAIPFPLRSGSWSDVPGLYVPDAGAWFLRSEQSAGPADLTYTYGPGGLGWIPLVGDWDGDGSSTAGLYDPSTGMWFLRNSHDAGPADVTFQYGPGGLGWKPVVGDWNGSQRTSIGLYDPATGMWFLRNSLTAGSADVTFSYGPGGLGWTPLAGDWDGDGVDTAGLYDPATGNWFLKNLNEAGAADETFQFGPAGLGWAPLVGDWDGDVTATPGLYAPSSGGWFLRNEFAGGAADVMFQYGPQGVDWTPVVGSW